MNLVSGKSVFYEQKWQKVPIGIQFISENSNRGISFEVPIPPDLEPSDHIIISYTFPFNLNDITYMTDKL